jgi:glutamyl/glutaminyl-tRNA synthetase
VFNPEKLAWFNQQHILRLSGAEILARLRGELEAAGLASAVAADPVRAARAADLVKPRARKLADIVAHIRPFLVDTIERDPAAVAKHLSRRSQRPRRGAAPATVSPFDPPRPKRAARVRRRARHQARLHPHARRHYRGRP